MCGIAGIACREAGPIDAIELGGMCSALLKRGPDEQAYYFNPGIGLALRRLSIIGLEAGRQPVHNEDGTVVVVMNGEIYNYRALRAELEHRGHVFATDTDTETIAHLYEERGEECVNVLRGMFAFALWDAREKRLFLARDRIGIKPLYYGQFGDRFVFASELKAILALPWVKREIDWLALDHLLCTMTTPGSESIVAGIHKLEPGHTLSWSRKGALRKRRYWRFRFAPDPHRSEADTIEMLRERLEETVRVHLVSDVPVGAFLSGGIDSSAVVAMMTRVSNRPVKTFSVGFRESSHDESSYAKAVAAYLGTEHHELILDSDMAATIEDFAWHMDEPFGDVSALAMFAVSRLASQQLKVVLSGDGGDELFAGYDHYLVEQRERRREAIPQPLRGLIGGLATRMPEGARGRNFLRHLALSGIERWRDAGMLFREEARQALFNPEIIEHLHGVEDVNDHSGPSPWEVEADWLSRLQHDDLEGYLPLDVLTKVDRMSMAHSLEARVPLLDHEFVEFAASIPAHMRLRGTQTKYIFKKSLLGVLPHEVLYRKKQGFGVPIGAWMRANLEPMVRELLLSRSSRCARFLNQDYIARLMALHQRGRGMDLQLWTLVSFELWCRRFLDTRRPVPVEQSGALGWPLMASGL